MTQVWTGGRWRLIAGALSVLLLMGSGHAYAQAVGTAAVRGHVSDETGAVVPGVTVTVSSPSLQLRERNAVSDDQGEYQIRSLPLGTYTVKFELQGFQTIQREGIQLSAGFEARIDAVLKVSAVQETVTVSGQSPVIDVTTTTISSNLTSELLDVIPTSRSIGEAIAMAPGVRYSGAIDVGGNRTGQFASGGNNFGSSQQSPFLEGINTRLFEGGSMAYLDQRALDEIQVTAVGSSAEFATPGVAWTGIVKSGGNDFHGLGSYDGQYPSLQANNVDQELLDQGLDPSGNSIKSYYDFTGQLGGKIIQDKLWFFGAYRSIKRVSNELGFFAGPGPDGNYATQGDNPLATRTMWNPGYTAKLSYQPATNHRFVGFVSRSIKNERQRGASVFVPLESTWNYWYDPTPWKVEYQWTPSNRTMVNAMWGDSSYLAQWRAQDGADVSGNPMTNDINTGFTTGPAATARNPNKNHQLNASMNYFPERTLAGRHELKIGFQQYVSVYGVEYTNLTSGNYIRIFDSSKNKNAAEVANAADYAYQVRTEDRPVQADSKMNNPNVFFVDTWRINPRLTANVGIRYEHHHLFSRGGVKEASQFGTPGTFGDMDILTFNDVAPRLGASWDMLGTGKTVLKGQWGRYLHMAAANYGSSFNPATVTVNRYLWNDTNKNNLLDDGEIGNFVDSAQRSSASGISTTPRPNVNPDLEQAHTDETSLTFEQELVNNMSFRGLALYKRVSNDYGNVQTLRPYEVWNIPITRVDPGPDGDALTLGDNGGLVTFYDYQAAYRGAQFEPTTPINRASDRNDSYKGFELTLTKRQSRGWMALGSFQMLKNHLWTGTSATPSNPNQEIFAVDNTWDWSGKLMGSYRAPYDINLSALYNFLAGVPRQRTYQFRSVPNATSVTIPLEEWGASRDPDQHVVNVKAARFFRLGPNRLQLSFDVYNLLNVNTATTIRYVSSATYGAISAILPPRIARVGVEFTF